MLRISVFPVLILRPVFSVAAATRPKFSCASCCLWERRLISSAKSRSSSCLANVHWISVLWPLPHNPIHHQQKYCRRQCAALTYTGLYLEGVGQLSLVYDLAGGIFIQLLDDGDVHGGKAVVLHKPPDDFPVHNFKCLLEIHEDTVQGDCHSRDCSMTILIVAMWSVHDLS